MKFHETVHGVYFDDLDVFGILHNARYLLLFERTIGAFWRRLGWKGTLEVKANPDQYQLVRANHVEYLHPVEGVGDVRVRVWVEKLGKTSLTFGFALLLMDQDVECARGSRVLVKVDPVTKVPSPWTPAFREQLASFRRDTDAP
jgi:acyl-CoA thioester hydrolase